MRGRTLRTVILTLGALSLVFALSPSLAFAEDVSIHGFASQGYLKSTANNYLGNTEDGSAEYQEFAFNISSQIQDDLRVGVQFFARDLGPLGNNEIELDWAFGDYHWQDQLGVRVGRYKMPYGFYNETADFDAARTSIVMPSGVYDQRFRDLLVAANGIQAYGNLNMFAGMSGSVDYSAFYGTTGVRSGGSVERTFDAEYASLPNPALGGISTGQGLASLEVNSIQGGSLNWTTPLEGLRVGGSLVNFDADFNFEFTDPMFRGLYAQFSGGMMELPFTTQNTNFSVVGGEYTFGNFVFAAEQSRWIGTFNAEAPSVVAQVDANLFDPGVPPGVATVDIPIELSNTELNRQAWYVQGSYRVNDWFEVGSYYSMYYDDGDNKDRDDPSSYQQDIALSTRFDISYAMTFKLEAHFMQGYGQLLSDINPTLLSGGSDLDENWTMIAAKTSFVF